MHGQPSLLFHAELELKRLTLLSTPRGGLLWVCVDPDSYAAAEGPNGNALAELLTVPNLVVKVVENRPAINIRTLQTMLRGLAAQGIAIALEIDSPIARWASQTGFHAQWFCTALAPGEHLHSNPRMSRLERILADVHRTGTRTLLSGLRDLGDLARAADLGFSSVSGPLFDATAFTHWAEPVGDPIAQAA